MCPKATTAAKEAKTTKAAGKRPQRSSVDAGGGSRSKKGRLRLKQEDAELIRTEVKAEQREDLEGEDGCLVKKEEGSEGGSVKHEDCKVEHVKMEDSKLEKAEYKSEDSDGQAIKLEDPGPMPVGRSFTSYWTPYVTDRYRTGAGPPLGFHSTGGNALGMQHKKLVAGDRYYPLVVADWKLYVLGRLVVSRVHSKDEVSSWSYDKYSQWHSDHGLGIIEGCYRPTVLVEFDSRWSVMPNEGVEVDIDRLQWVRPDGTLRPLKLNAQVTPHIRLRPGAALT